MKLTPSIVFPDTFEPTEVGYELFTEEHKAFRKTVTDFVDKEIAANAEHWEQQEDFPRELFGKAAHLGLFGLKFPDEYGGSGPDYVAEAVAIEELARGGSGGVAADLGAHKDLALLYIYNFGDSEQRDRWLTPGVSGSKLGCLAITEVDAGSDVAGIQTKASKDGDSYVLNGSKVYITNGGRADFAIVAAKTDPEGGHDGISLFVVDADTEGFTRKRMRMLGWRTSHTGELTLTDCRVPASNLLGAPGRGFYQIMQNFQWERLAMALGETSGARATYQMAKKYGLERKAFGRQVARMQVWRHRFADLISEIEMSRALNYHALRKFIHGEVCVAEVSMAKNLASQIAFKVADEAVQIHGGYGYMMEFPAQRAWRDSRVGAVGGGTTEVLNDVIARILLD